MSFRISSDVDKNKVFLVMWSNLEGRLDPNYCHPKRLCAIQKIRQSQDKSEKLHLITSFMNKTVKPVFGNEIYVGLENIESNTGVFIESEKKDIVSSALSFKKGQVLFPKLRPYLNKVYCAEFDGVCSTEFHVLDSRKIDNKYLAHFLSLDIVVTQTALLMSGNTLPRLQTEDVKNLWVPIPPTKIQAQVVSKMDLASVAKKQQQEEAQKLLDGIDDYLLGELGIELPEQEENTLQSRIFTRQLSEVSGGRFSAPIHQKKYTLNTKKYPMGLFRDCVHINPLTSFSNIPPDMLATFVPMEKISDKNGEADTSISKTVNQSFGYTKFQENDLIWAKITPSMQNGKSAVVKGLENGIGFGSTEFHVFRAKPEVEIDYIHGLLRLRSLREHAVLYFSGAAGQQRVADEFFKKLSIPKPDLKKQIQIANHIKEIRNQAKRLQEKAETMLEKAKQEVEDMILRA